jgi:hypothetical protein
MIDKPEVEGLTWLSDTLAEVVIPLFNKRDIELGIKGDLFYDKEIIDLTKLACIRDYYPDDNDTENYSRDELDEDGKSIYEVLVDIEGVNTHVLRITKEDLVKVWLYVKSLK